MKMSIRIRVDAHVHIDYLLYFMTGSLQVTEQLIDILDHVELELLVLCVQFLSVLFEDGLHEVPDLFLHVLCGDGRTLAWILMA
jgi:hypothetical protein